MVSIQDTLGTGYLTWEEGSIFLQVPFYYRLWHDASFKAWPGLFLEFNKVEAVVSAERSEDLQMLGIDGSHKINLFPSSGLTACVSLMEIKLSVHVCE